MVYYVNGKRIYPAVCCFCGSSAPLVDTNYIREEGDGFVVYLNGEKFDWTETEEEALAILVSFTGNTSCKPM